MSFGEIFDLTAVRNVFVLLLIIKSKELVRMICLDRVGGVTHHTLPELFVLARGGGWGGGEAGGAAQSVCGNYTFFSGDNCDGFGKNASVYHVLRSISWRKSYHQ